MPKFYYQALNSSGVTVSGSIEAADSWLARKAVSKEGLEVVTLGSRDFKTVAIQTFQAIKAYQGPVSLDDMLVLVSQLETGISVGLPLMKLFEMVQADIAHPGLREAIRSVKNDVSQGATLHKSFEKFPDIFDRTFVGLIRAGELSGKLENVLGMIFKLMEQKSENRARIKTATFYPKIVLCFMVVVMLVVVYFIIPKIKAFLTSFGQELPPITQFVVTFSDFFVHYWYMVAAGCMGVYISLRNYSKSPAGSFKIDRYKLWLPVLGEIFTQIELINFCIVLNLFLESGIAITEALNTLAKSQNNRIFRSEIAIIEKKVTGGLSLGKALSESTVFPSSLTGVIGIGEESGRMTEILVRMGKHYQLKVDFNLNRLSKLIEPMLLVVIFAMTLVLALAIFLPIWKMSSAVHSVAH